MKGSSFRACAHNSQNLIERDIITLDTADFLTLRVVAAGGHHSSGPPPLLPAGSSFIERCLFAEQTHGWLATDEMLHCIRQLQWRCPNFATFVGPVLWDSTGDIWHTVADAIVFRRGLRTILPLLIDNHWCAVEVNRQSSQISVRLVDAPQNLSERIRSILARLMSEQEDCLLLCGVVSPPSPHLCGWNLVSNWFSQADIADDIPDLIPTIRHLPLSVRNPVHAAMQASVQMWKSAGAKPEVWHLAHRLRQNHLCELAVSASASAPPVPFDLVTHAVSFSAIVGPAPTPAFLDSLCSRLAHFDNHGGWLASDELDFLLQKLRHHRLDIRFMPPASWHTRSGTIRYFQNVKPVCTAFPCCIWFLLVDRHWIQLEIVRLGGTAALYITAPRSHSDLVFPLRAWFAKTLGLSIEQILVFHIFQVCPDGFCGWALLCSLFQRCGIASSVFTPAHAHALTLTPVKDRITAIQHESTALWNTWTSDAALIAFAHAGRAHFLLHLLEGNLVQSYAAGGANDEAKESQPTSPRGTLAPGSASTSSDPLWVNDPWAAKSKPKRVQTRWEDLVLPRDHPFYGSNNALLPHTHRLKAASIKEGLILATRSSLPELLTISTKKTLGVLLPVSDLAAFGNLATKVTGPHEVVLEDPNLQASYKRLALLLPIQGTIKFQLAPAAHTCTAPEHTEVVLELDSRLLLPKDFSQATESPIQTFRKILQSIHSGLPDTLTLYGLRNGRHPSASKDDAQLQCMARIPKTARKSILEKSGVHGLLIRDFLERGQSTSDVTVLPRFWAPTVQDLHDMLIVTREVMGNAGLVLTRRGLALRVWKQQIGAAWKVLLADDPRLVTENIDIVPTHILESSGWPPAIDAQNVVRATLKATGKAPVPTKAFRAAGVHGWTLAFQEKPATLKFNVQINTLVYEILLAEPQAPMPRSNRHPQTKPQKPGKGKALRPSEPTPPPAPLFPPVVQKTSESDRIDRLESKMSQLDARQTSLETQLHTRFDDVGVQLQKILSSVQPNTRQRESETSPPSKLQKQQA